MPNPDDLTRRDALKRLAAAGATMRLTLGADGAESLAPITIAGQPVEFSVSSLGPTTVRI
jgi:hypothetical protein